MSSNNKEWILTQIRSRYESKFGTTESFKRILDSELTKLVQKDKISSEDLSELENKLVLRSNASSPVPKSTTNATPRKNIFSPRQIKLRGSELDINLMKSFGNDDKRESKISYVKTPTNELSISTTILPPIATNHLHPMELKILRSYESSPVAEKSFSPTKFEERFEHRSPKRETLNLSPKLVAPDLSQYRLSITHKTQQREKQMKQNIWKVLDDYNRKKAEEVEQAKVEKYQKQRDNWVEDLNKQILDKQKRRDDEKARQNQEDLKHVEYVIQVQAEQEQKEKNHKNHMKNVERENHRVAANAREQVKRIKSLEKEIEALNLDQAIDDYIEYKRRLEAEKLKKKKILLSMKTEEVTFQNKRIQEKRAHDKESDVIANQKIIEKIKQEEDKSATFLKQLKDRARNVKDAEPAIEKGYDNLRKYGQIGVENTKEGILSFMHHDRHDATAKYEKKKKLQAMLVDTYAGQKELQLEKSRHYKSYIEEQKDYWKKEEEDMNLREEAGARVARLKKQVLRDDLDAQREADSPLKNHFITPTEVWVNRKILKKLQAIPENFSDKISYLKNL